MTVSTSITLWDRVTSPGLINLPPEAARSILRMKLKRSVIERIHELSAITRKGRLIKSQRAELDLYLQIGHLLTLMHSQARLALRAPARKRRKSA